MGLMADGDLTEIGERGMNLSGGQRQRIAVARAVYARSDIVLLDSPLSAVDAYTSQHIFRHAILGLLRAEGSTVLLVTHAVELLPEADALVFMRDGAAAYVGAPTPAALKALFPAADAAESVDDVLFSALSGAPAAPVAAAQAAAEQAATEQAASELAQQLPAAASTTVAIADRPRDLPTSKSATLQRALSVRGMTVRVLDAAADASPIAAAAAGKDTAPPSTMTRVNSVRATARTRSRASTTTAAAAAIRSMANASAELPLALPGMPSYEALMAKRVAARIGAAAGGGGDSGGNGGGSAAGGRGGSGGAANSYLVLLKELRIYIFVSVVAVFVATQLVRIYSDIWVSVWSTRAFGERGRDYYLGVYGGYVAVFATLLYLRGIAFYQAFVAAATRLHDKMFAALLRAPMSFFTLTPLGGVLSSVSRDMDLITEYLLEDAYMVLVYVMILGTTIGVVVRQVPVFAAVAFVLLALSGFVFLRSGRVRSGRTGQQPNAEGPVRAVGLAYVARARSGSFSELKVSHPLHTQTTFRRARRPRGRSLSSACRPPPPPPSPPPRRGRRRWRESRLRRWTPWKSAWPSQQRSPP